MNERIKTIIADDEPLALAALRDYATRDDALEIVAECRDGVEVVEAARATAPELLLLDVQMPLLDGFEALNHLALDPAPTVIFVTAYDEYAVQGFAAGAVDYLVKPFDASRFATALARAKHHVYGQRASADDGMDANILPSAGGSPAPHLDRILVRQGRTIIPLPTDSIDWIEAASNYIRIHAGSDVYMIRMKLSTIEHLLDRGRFARIHRTTIVNISRVVSLTPHGGRGYIVTLEDGTQLSMSQKYRSSVMGRYFIASERFQ